MGGPSCRETRDGLVVLEENINTSVMAQSPHQARPGLFRGGSDYGSWGWEDIVAPAVAQAEQDFLCGHTFIFGGTKVPTMDGSPSNSGLVSQKPGEKVISVQMGALK